MDLRSHDRRGVTFEHEHQEVNVANLKIVYGGSADNF